MTLALQLFKNCISTQEKLRLNLHSLSVSELLEYGRLSAKIGAKSTIGIAKYFPKHIDDICFLARTRVTHKGCDGLETEQKSLYYVFVGVYVNLYTVTVIELIVFS
jgi:hypothetical protein